MSATGFSEVILTDTVVRKRHYTMNSSCKTATTLGKGHKNQPGLMYKCAAKGVLFHAISDLRRRTSAAPQSPTYMPPGFAYKTRTSLRKLSDRPILWETYQEWFWLRDSKGI